MARKSATPTRSPPAPAPVAPTPTAPTPSPLELAAKRWAGMERSERYGVLEALGSSVCDNPRVAAAHDFTDLVEDVRAALARKL